MARTTDFFGAMASTYDASIRRGHPYYDEMLAEVTRTVPERANSVLELGCGTGALSARLLERYPGASLTLVDASSEMLGVVRERLHHVANKAPFYRRIREWLQPDGWLVFGDELTGTVSYVEHLHLEDWQGFARLPGHWSEEEIAAALRHCEEADHYETLARQLELLAGAGFDPVDCAWRHSNYALFVAQA